MTVHLQGIWAVITIGGICLVACTPVWIASLLARDWMMDRIEAKFRRRMAELGRTPEEVDEDWADALTVSRGGDAR
jgi:hypothetical protein